VNSTALAEMIDKWTADGRADDSVREAAG
jgi:hypothetical protein